MALRMSADTGAPVFSEMALKPLMCSSASHIFVRFMYAFIHLQAVWRQLLFWVNHSEI